MPDELDSIFPDLQGLLNADWDTSGSSGLETDPDHGGVTAESLDAFLRQSVGAGRSPLPPLATSGGGVVEGRVVPVGETQSSPAEPSPDGGDPDDDLEPDEPDEPGDPSIPPLEPPEPDSSLDSLIDVGGGRQMTRAQLEAFARFSDSLDSDPALQQLLTSYYTGRVDALQPQQTPPGGVVPPAAPVVPPADPAYLAFDEADDPRLGQLANLVRQQQAQIAQLAQATQAVATQTIVRSAQEAESLMSRAATSFAEQHNLSDDEIKRLRLSAGRMRVLEPLMSGIDPITGAPSRPDILSATERALEIAMYADPAMRQRQIDATIAAQRTRNRKRQKLAGVGGSGGSVSRAPATVVVGTPEAHKQMISEVGEMLAGTWNP